MLLAIAWIGPLVEAALLAGLIVRRRIPDAPALAVLAAVLFASDSTHLACPSCNTWSFWTAKEFLHVVLFSWLGIETAVRASHEAPTRRAIWRWSAFVAAVTLGLVLTAPDGSPIVQILPRLMGALAWLYTGLAVIMLRHDARVTPLQDSVLAGFTPYLIVYAATWSRADWDTSAANLVNPVMCIVVLAIIARAAWRSDTGRRSPWLRRSPAAAFRLAPIQRAGRSEHDRRRRSTRIVRPNATDAHVTTRHIER